MPASTRETGVYDWNVVDDTIHFSDNVQKAGALRAALQPIVS
jgi:hypothetical protein